jgi:hypothetical protein
VLPKRPSKQFRIQKTGSDKVGKRSKTQCFLKWEYPDAAPQVSIFRREEFS